MTILNSFLKTMDRGDLILNEIHTLKFGFAQPLPDAEFNGP